MNKHIELVKKWLADPSSVSLEELQASAAKAAAAVDAAVDDAAYAAAVDDAAYAKYWVKRYEELKKETDA